MVKPVRKFVAQVLAPYCPFNWVRILLYRICGFKIGKHCFIGMRCYLDDMCYDMLKIGIKVNVRELTWTDYYNALTDYEDLTKEQKEDEDFVEIEYDMYYGEVKLRNNFDITQMLQERLKNKRVADWFSDRWILFNECSILSVEDGQVCQHRPDRVMTDGHEWIVVDFKFGSPKPEYQDQVRQYMNLIQKMSLTSSTSPLISIRGYLWYVYSNQIEEVTLSSNHL